MGKEGHSSSPILPQANRGMRFGDESGGFDKLLREPFLLSSEQDELISGLRRQGFFKKFAYDAEEADWYARDAYAKSHERERRSK